MSIHDAFLELAASAIDFDLEPDEITELDRHLGGCDTCRQTSAALRDDASAIASASVQNLSPARSEAILAQALRPRARRPRIRLVAVAVLIAVVGVAIVAAGMGFLRFPGGSIAAVPTSPGTSSGPGNGSGPSTSAGLTPVPNAGTPRPLEPPSAGELPVRGSAQELGSQARMAPGPAGSLYVSVPTAAGTVLVALLDSDGRPRSGWPIVLKSTTACDQLLPVDDGSVRLLCTLENPEQNIVRGVRAYAFDSAGVMLAGWPIDLDDYFAARVIGDVLFVHSQRPFGDDVEVGQPAGNSWMLEIAADATVRVGELVEYTLDCCLNSWAVGPDGISYGTTHRFGDASTAPTSELTGVGFNGTPAGFPVEIDGIASKPAFDEGGRIHVTVGSPLEPPARALVFDSNGRSIGGSDELGISATSDWSGAGGEFPAAPLVYGDGETLLVDTTDGTTVTSVDPEGQVMSGWPYRSSVRLEQNGVCQSGDTGCGTFRAAPTTGRFGILYLLLRATNSSVGGSVIAIGQDGRVRNGWPVELKRPGAEFWSVVTGPDGTAYVLAIEPEPNGSHSATIVAIGLDSTVSYTATIIEP